MTESQLTVNRHTIADKKWRQIEKLFPAYTTKLSNRVALNTVLWQLKVDSPWRNLPAKFGS